MRGCTAVRLDLTEMSFLDSCGLNALLRLRLSLQRRDLPLTVRGLQGQPCALFDLVGAYTVFDTAEPTTPSLPRRTRVLSRCPG